MDPKARRPPASPENAASVAVSWPVAAADPVGSRNRGHIAS
jgi:hypothetical protein